MRQRRSGHQAWPSNLSQEQHGTAYRYGSLKCRCPRCTAAWRLYRAGEVGYSQILRPPPVSKLETDWWPARA